MRLIREPYAATYEELYQLYVVQKLTKKEIADKHGVKPQAVAHRLEKLKIKDIHRRKLKNSN